MTVALQGEQGKPRPALVIQADHFNDLLAIAVLPITGTLVPAPLLRIEIEPGPSNGMTKPSHMMVDKLQTPPRSKVGRVIGRLDPPTMLRVDRALAVYLGPA